MKHKRCQKRTGHPVGGVLGWWRNRQTLRGRVQALEATQRLIVGRLNALTARVAETPPTLSEPVRPTIAPPVVLEGQPNLNEHRRGKWGFLAS